MKDLSNQDILHTLFQRSRYASKTLNTYLKKHELFASQWTILFCIHQYGPMTQTDLWTYINVEAPTITRTLVKMEENGWIKRRQGQDKRERIIELTDQAREEFASIQQSVFELEEDVLGNLTQEDKNQLYHLLMKIGL